MGCKNTKNESMLSNNKPVKENKRGLVATHLAGYDDTLSVGSLVRMVFSSWLLLPCMLKIKKRRRRMAILSLRPLRFHVNSFHRFQSPDALWAINPLIPFGG